MSLINDVLEQIDARAPVMEPERVIIEPSSYRDTAKKMFRLPPSVTITALALCGFLSGYGFLAFVQTPAADINTALHSLQDTHQIASVNAASLPERHTELNAHSAPLPPSEELSLTGQLNPIVAAAPQTASSEEVALLVLANQYFLADRLTYPPLQNAYQLYREILLKNPNHTAALEGIASIKRRYLTLTAEAIAQGARDKAQRYIERAEFVGVDKQELNNLREQLPLVLPYTTPALGEQTDEASVDAEPLAGRSLSVANTLGLTAPVIDSAKTSLNPSSVNRPSAAEVNLSVAPQNEQAFLARLAEDKSSEQQALAFIKSRGNSVDTVRWLARRWVSAQEWLPLLDLMNTSSALSSTERDVFRAQALLGLKNYSELVGWLQAAQNSQQPELQRILAVALQKTGREADALGIYQHLVAHNPDNSGLWLALGLSADNLGNSVLAREAFFRAQQLGGHSKTVSDFLARKLAAATP